MKGLLCLDLIHEIMDPTGKFAGHGYPAFGNSHGSLAAVARLQNRFRDAGADVLHVRVGFTAGYPEWPEHSPLFGAAKAYGALQLGTWATEFCDGVQPQASEVIITKHRVNAFHGTALDLILRTMRVDELFICGVSTDLAVNSTVRTAHDLDYRVSVIADACVAANGEDHNNTLATLMKVAKVLKVDEVRV